MSPDSPPNDPHEAEGTIVGRPGAHSEAGAAATTATCPVCGQPLELDSRFCQECGARTAAAMQAEAESEAEEKRRPWFPLVVALWLIIMVAALYFVYAHALVVGSI